MPKRVCGNSKASLTFIIALVLFFFSPALCGFGDFLEACFLIASWSYFFILSLALCGCLGKKMFATRLQIYDFALPSQIL
jgi:hypothetical protein